VRNKLPNLVIKKAEYLGRIFFPEFITQGTYYLLTYILTPWSGVLLEKLIGFQLVKKFSAFYGTRKFITAVTCARHLSLS